MQFLCAEYALNGVLSDKVDVFSYGVVLLELVSGRHGMQTSAFPEDPDRISMAQWAWEMNMAGQALAIAAPALGNDFDREDFIRMVELALWCTQNHPQMRPNMSQVNIALPTSITHTQIYILFLFQMKRISCLYSSKFKKLNGLRN